MRTIPILLVALIVAIANTPLDIFDVHAWNVGTIKVEPWRRTAAPMAARVADAVVRLRAWLTNLGGVPLIACETGEAAIDLLTAGLTGPRVRVLHQAHADTLNEISKIRATVKSEARAMTDDERAQVKKAEAKLEGITEELALEKKAQDREKANAAAEDAAQRQQARNEGNARIQVGKDLTLDDPKKGFRSHLEFMQKVMEAPHLELRGKNIDARLEPLRIRAAAGSDEASGNEGQFGGFLVPMGFSPTLLQITPEDDPTATLVTPVPMSNPIVSIPARTDKDHTTSVSGGLIVTRKRETVLGTSARMQLEQVQLHANAVFGLSYATEEILTDSPISFAAIIAAGFRDQFTSHLFNERLNGSGSGEPLGILNSPALVTIAKETGQATKTIVTENIDKMVAAQWRYGRSIWLANHDTLPQLLALSRSVGVGGSIVPYLMPANDQGSGQFQLLGRPIYFSEYPATLGTVGDIINACWSEVLHGTYQPLDSAESIHVRFETHERTFKFWLRDDSQPWWRSSLKPKRGASNLSPFVALATR